MFVVYTCYHYVIIILVVISYSYYTIIYIANIFIMNTLLFSYIHIYLVTHISYYKYNKEDMATAVEVMKTGIIKEDTAP